MPMFLKPTFSSPAIAIKAPGFLLAINNRSLLSSLELNEETLEPVWYYNKIPKNHSIRQAYVIDPMLATGGTLIMAFHYLIDLGATDITAVCILSAPEGIAAVEKEFANSKVPITIVTGALDEKLNEHGYIVPGLGDAGDRLYGVV